MTPLAMSNRGGGFSFGMLHHEDESDNRNPPMCGQAFVTKVMRNHQQKHREQAPSSMSRRKLFLRKTVANRSRNSCAYDDILSLEQPQDTESESSKASSERERARDQFSEKAAAPDFIVQFDPVELELINMEKQFDAAPRSPNKQRQAKVPSPFRGIARMALPTVAEEMSFELEDKSVRSTSTGTGTQPDRLSYEAADMLLAPSSTTSSSSSSIFFDGIINADSRDEAETNDVESERDTPPENVSPHANPQQNILSSPEKMELLTAMRQMILKQQEAIKIMSEQNLIFKHKLASCQKDMDDMRRGNAEQEVRITRLVLQKEAFESESTWLRAEVTSLKSELAYLKSDDDLTKRFERLMEDDTKSNSDDSSSLEGDQLLGRLLTATDSFENNISSESSINDAINKIADDKEWGRMVSSFDNVDAQPRKSKQTVESKANTDDRSTTSTGLPGRYEDESASTNGNCLPGRSEDESVSTNGNSVSTVAATIAGIAGQASKSSASFGRKPGGVADFKNRLGEIQKKRMMRKPQHVQSVGKASIVRFA